MVLFRGGGKCGLSKRNTRIHKVFFLGGKEGGGEGVLDIDVCTYLHM